MTTDITYNIATHKMSGVIDGTKIDSYAGSGGRAGSKVDGAVNDYLANNALATHIKKPGTHIFGPVPQGRYYMRLHESRTNWIRLVPAGSNIMYDRSGFAIHGRGTVGSHGCIVPDNFNIVLTLCSILKKREKEGLDAPVLDVIAVSDRVDQKFNMA